jgi:hypothetical protein
MKSIDNRYRMKQLILYIADRLKEADHLGATKLNKVLYRADHEAFRLLGRKITTFRYQKNKLGPTLCAFKHLTEEMAAEGPTRSMRLRRGSLRRLVRRFYQS